MELKNCSCKDTTIIEGIFGEIRLDDDITPIIIKSYTMINVNNVEITIITWGASIVSIKCPDKYGRSNDVVLGFDDLKSYTNPTVNPYIGCVLGRCANRIKDGQIKIENQDYQLSRNDENGHHLHGGASGFGRQIWDSHIDGCTLVMTYLSENGEEGYPGSILTTVRFTLTHDNKLEICIRATCSKPTLVNISHGSYFNLAGHDAGEEELRQHTIMLNSDRWTFAEFSNPVPTGSIRGVGGTVMDLRIPKLLGECMDKVPPGEGFDHNFCVVKNWSSRNNFVARVVHPLSGRAIEIYSDQPGLQLYTAGRFPSLIKAESKDTITDTQKKEEIAKEKNQKLDESPVIQKESLPDLPKCEFIPGKKGASYTKFCAFSIQPQNYPNAINYSHFPCSILRPGQMYYHDLTYKFGVQLANYMY
ncbi:galactose mutarotase-like [Prorops nasuta]|uniref:galactose mutarotase-like n=1 Tax=Prorops nasuta TaxID=863751 RepID=UPI0034CFB138